MAKVICEWVACANNKNGECKKETINLKNFHMTKNVNLLDKEGKNFNLRSVLTCTDFDWE